MSAPALKPVLSWEALGFAIWAARDLVSRDNGRGPTEERVAALFACLCVPVDYVYDVRQHMGDRSMEALQLATFHQLCSFLYLAEAAQLQGRGVADLEERARHCVAQAVNLLWIWVTGEKT